MHASVTDGTSNAQKAPMMSRVSHGPQARIGPNSVLHLVPLLDEALGNVERERLMQLSGMTELPSEFDLMAEEPAARLHQALRQQHPAIAAELTRRAGEKTGDNIIRQRIPIAAMRVMRELPAWLAGPLLASVIAKHAWSFAGSGTFRLRSRHPLVFTLKDNPVVRGEQSKDPVCDWHVAVFEYLFREIVDSDLRCVETQCCAAGADTCRFEIS
ncbi:MAG: bacteriochlorophyll 4-vinyl reductase [Congregibacter sp.]